MRNLREAGMLSLKAILQAESARLETLLRPAGYFRQKTRRLQELTAFILASYGPGSEFTSTEASIRRWRACSTSRRKNCVTCCWNKRASARKLLIRFCFTAAIMRFSWWMPTPAGSSSATNWSARYRLRNNKVIGRSTRCGSCRRKAATVIRAPGTAAGRKRVARKSTIHLQFQRLTGLNWRSATTNFTPCWCRLASIIA